MCNCSLFSGGGAFPALKPERRTRTIATQCIPTSHNTKRYIETRALHISYVSFSIEASRGSPRKLCRQTNRFRLFRGNLGALDNYRNGYRCKLIWFIYRRLRISRSHLRRNSNRSRTEERRQTPDVRRTSRSERVVDHSDCREHSSSLVPKFS